MEIDKIDTSKKFGLALKRIRKQKKITQDELAKKIKMRQATISEVENGGGTVETIFKIIQELRINLILDSEKSENIKSSNATEFFNYLSKIEKVKNG